MQRRPVVVVGGMAPRVDHRVHRRRAAEHAAARLVAAPPAQARLWLGLEAPVAPFHRHEDRSEEHTSELQSLMRISYAVFCLKKKKQSTDYATAHIATKPRHPSSPHRQRPAQLKHTINTH